MESEIVPLVIFISVAVLWLIMALQCTLVYIRFLRKCPEEALRYVTPFGYGSTKNVTFLFRKESVALLRQHADLWKLRQRAVGLIVASVLWPILCMVVLGIVLALYT